VAVDWFVVPRCCPLLLVAAGARPMPLHSWAPLAELTAWTPQMTGEEHRRETRQRRAHVHDHEYAHVHAPSRWPWRDGGLCRRRLHTQQQQPQHSGTVRRGEVRGQTYQSPSTAAASFPSVPFTPHLSSPLPARSSVVRCRIALAKRTGRPRCASDLQPPTRTQHKHTAKPSY
jgi:hypothetical protein